MSRCTLATACSVCLSDTRLSLCFACFPKTVRLPSVPFMRSIPQDARILVWAPPRSLAATYGIEFSFFSSGYLDVSVPRVPFMQLCVYCMIPWVFHGGFPHSDISGSSPICGSPKLFAAYYVLLRLLVPRHPPCALCSLIIHRPCARNFRCSLRAFVR